MYEPEDLEEDPDERQTHRSHFTMPSGRKVYLARLQMSLTYAGQMEGGRVSCSRYIRERMPERVKDEFAPHQKLIVIDDGGRALPDVRWLAEFSSGGGVKTDDSEYFSQLCLCWFSDDLPTDFNAFFQQTLAKINWEEDAEDYSIMW